MQVDDERHMVFECPELERFRVFRTARKHLFNRSVGKIMLAFMTQKDPSEVGSEVCVGFHAAHPGPPTMICPSLLWSLLANRVLLIEEFSVIYACS